MIETNTKFGPISFSFFALSEAGQSKREREREKEREIRRGKERDRDKPMLCCMIVYANIFYLKPQH